MKRNSQSCGRSSNCRFSFKTEITKSICHWVDSLSKERSRIMRNELHGAHSTHSVCVVHPLHAESSNRMTGNWQTNLKIYQPVVELEKSTWLCKHARSIKSAHTFLVRIVRVTCKFASSFGRSFNKHLNSTYLNSGWASSDLVSNWSGQRLILSTWKRFKFLLKRHWYIVQWIVVGKIKCDDNNTHASATAIEARPTMA